MNRREFLGTVAAISCGTVIASSIKMAAADGWLEIHPLDVRPLDLCRLRCRLRAGYEIAINPDPDGRYRIPPGDYLAIIWDGEFLEPPFSASIFLGAG
jgi:hypothetical protein